MRVESAIAPSIGVLALVSLLIPLSHGHGHLNKVRSIDAIEMQGQKEHREIELRGVIKIIKFR